MVFLVCVRATLIWWSYRRTRNTIMVQGVAFVSFDKVFDVCVIAIIPPPFLPPNLSLDSIPMIILINNSVLAWCVTMKHINTYNIMIENDTKHVDRTKENLATTPATAFERRQPPT